MGGGGVGGGGGGGGGWGVGGGVGGGVITNDGIMGISEKTTNDKNTSELEPSIIQR